MRWVIESASRFLHGAPEPALGKCIIGLGRLVRRKEGGMGERSGDVHAIFGSGFLACFRTTPRKADEFVTRCWRFHGL